MNPRFVLTSRWRLHTARAPVWALLTDVESWPRWWRHVRHARLLERPPGSPLGDVAQIDWAGALIGRVRLRLRTTLAERPRLLEGRASGDLCGVGAWILEPVPEGGVDVTCRWEFELQRRWQQRGSALLRPVFEWNHFAVMRAGARGMAQALDCGLSHASEWSGHWRG